jgi:pyruvate dehydrogenase E2 component (dihydrolipoamide acetyltransferase)
MITEVIMPQLGETMNEGTITRWVKKEGDKVQKGEVLLEITTDKATLEVESFASGHLRKILVKDGEAVPVLTVIGYIGEPNDPLPEQKPGAAPGVQKPEKETPLAKAEAPGAVASVLEPGKVAASPRAKKLAQEKGIDISKVIGTGPGGRIIEKDVLEYEAKHAVVEAGRQFVQLTPMRRIVAQRMTESKTRAPHFYMTVEIDMDKAIRLREQTKDGDFKVSYHDIIARAAGIAIAENKMINAVWADDKIAMREKVNIGIAVALDEGLVVPVIHDVSNKSLKQIASESKSLIDKARGKKLLPEEYSGGTITISNVGMFDIENFAAIINPGESVILGAGRIVEKPVVVSGSIVIRPMMNLTLSCDHRVIDGAVAGKFLKRLKDLLEKEIDKLK